jgi:uncharacterized membrane-anchored protein YitT (DUF2179 family)
LKPIKFDKDALPATVAGGVKKTALVAAGALLMALNLKTFCIAAGVIPGGFSGLTVLTIEIAERYFHLQLPFSILYYVLNAVPVYIGFRYIGKWFTALSCFMVVLTGLFTDMLPATLLSYLNLDDKLLCAVFGGVINAVSITLCLLADATSGGTDFIAIYYAEKKGRDMWGAIFVANCVVLLIAAVVLNPGKALYSIIFQFAQTMGLNGLYKGYQRKTLLIITNHDDEIYRLIRDRTNHDATLFTGIGKYKDTERRMLYSVVSSTDVHPLITAIKRADPSAFVNVLKTEFINGNFYHKPID